MNAAKYVGMDVHKETVSIAVVNSAGKLLMETTAEKAHQSQGGGAAGVHRQTLDGGARLDKRPGKNPRDEGRERKNEGVELRRSKKRRTMRRTRRSGKGEKKEGGEEGREEGRRRRR